MTDLKIDVDIHDGDNKECIECWDGYPKKCLDCGGLVHASFGDENRDGDYWLAKKCSGCGDDYELEED
ncbi:hypothetical protein KAR91_07535 [Candidatus Pacearchaeota archaeon]|nr:hypothetical protein [Candidatus Pacearchaeota archaeon]